MNTYELQSLKRNGKRIMADFATDAEALAWADAEMKERGFTTAQLVRFRVQQIGFTGIQRNRASAGLVTVYSNK